MAVECTLYLARPRTVHHFLEQNLLVHLKLFDSTVLYSSVQDCSVVYSAVQYKCNFCLIYLPAVQWCTMLDSGVQHSQISPILKE